MIPWVDTFNSIVDWLNEILWGFPGIMVILLPLAGIYFTIRLGFIQFRHFGHMFAVMRNSTKAKHGGVSSFGAFTTSLAARVGTGNIAGVATALVAGGPGAIFWMWVIALIGMCTAMVEATLAQVFKHRDEDEPSLFRGGPAYYMQRGLNSRLMGVLFSISLIIAFGFAFNGVQANSIAAAMNEAFEIPNGVTAAVLVAAVALVIFGGIRRIAHVAEFVVPFMAVTYLAVALVVVVMNIGEIPGVISLIVQSAFGVGEFAGGAIGYTIKVALENGVKRGLFSNEAGQGSAPNAAATADVDHPAQQGYVQALGVFVDTLIICTATASMILLSGVYSSGFVDGVYDGEANATGVALTQQSLSDSVGSWGSNFIAVALLFFAFTSILANYYYGETSLLFMNNGNHHWLAPLRILVLGMVVVGALITPSEIWNAADVAMGIMATLNIVAILLLSNTAVKVIRDYDKQWSAGLSPRFTHSSIPELADRIEPDVWQPEEESQRA